MKSFIFNSIIFFALGAVATVGVFYLINKNSLTPNDFYGVQTTQQSIEETIAEAQVIQETLDKVPEAGIPLSSVKLSDTQKSTLQTVGIDPQSFVITKDMVACSVEKLGAERTQALVAGGSPSLIEVTMFTPCLNRSE